MNPILNLVLATSLRTAVVMAALVVGLRVVGKRQTGEMNIYDLAMVMLVANAVQNAMTAGKGNLSVGLASAGTLLLVGFALSMIFVRVPKLERLVAGTPTVLVSNGHVMEGHMRRENVTMNQLLAAARIHEVTDILKIRLAVLEIDGDISIVTENESPEGNMPLPPASVD